MKEKKRNPVALSILLVVILAIGFFLVNSNQGNKTTQQEEMNNAQSAEELRLEAALSKIRNVGEVKLYFYYEGSATANSKKNNRLLSEYFQLSEQSSTDPSKPGGVLVVAEGAEEMSTKNEIISILSRVLQIPVHRIVVVPMEKKGEE